MADSKSFRISDETKEKFDKFAKGNFANADEAFNALIDTYNLDRAAGSEFGQSLKADLDAFRKYNEGIMKLYTNAIERGNDALDIATSKVKNRLETAEAATAALKSQVAAAEEQAALAKAAQAQAEAQAREAQAKAAEATETVAALKAAVSSLTEQLKATKDLFAALNVQAVAPAEAPAPAHDDDEPNLFSDESK